MSKLSTGTYKEMEDYIAVNRDGIRSGKITCEWSGWHDENDLVLRLKDTAGEEVAELRRRVWDGKDEREENAAYRTMLEKYGIPMEG